MEEHKEADTTTGRATHRISRGIHDKVCLYVNFLGYYCLIAAMPYVEYAI